MKKFKDIKEGDSLYVVLFDDWKGVNCIECKLTKDNYERDFFDRLLYVWAQELKPYLRTVHSFEVDLENYSDIYIYDDGIQKFSMRIFTDKIDANLFYRDYKDDLIKRHKDALKKLGV